MLHSYNGNLETAQKAIHLNFYIGVTGPVTYKNAEEKREGSSDNCRLTDYSSKQTRRFSRFASGKRNEPAFVRYIADKIAEIHRTTREQVAQITAKKRGTIVRLGG